MLGILALAAFLLSGIVIADGLLARYGRMTRLWFGMTLGVILMEWLPSLFAFALRFTEIAQYAAVATALLLAAASLLIRKFRRSGFRPQSSGSVSEPSVRLVLGLVLPLLALSAALQYTHTLRPAADGSLHVGQSTYGDLCMHLGFATGFRGAAFPPEYTIHPGTMLGYPFLVDAMSSTMYLLGTPLNMAFVVPSTLMMGLVFWGFIMLAWEMCHDARAVVIAYLLLFLNGGLGFFYVFDRVIADPSRFWAWLTDFYQAPANMVDHNVRWVNVIADMMIPQRTTLAGWTAVLPALWLLQRTVKAPRRQEFVLLGVWAGVMPMIHTHSFFALGMISIGAMVYLLIRGDRAERMNTFFHFAIYGAIAIAVALPQLLTWAIPQTVGGGSLHFRFNWSNFQDGKLVDEYFWFWLKNVGPIYLLMIPAALSADKPCRALTIGALLTYTCAELIQFQPNEYDNNKLFYVAFILMLPLVAQYLTSVFDRLKGIRGRALIAACFMTVCLLSGAMSLVREAISDYELFSAGEAAAAEYIDKKAPRDAVILTGIHHDNPVPALSGRKIVCGTGSFLYYHGIDYGDAEHAVYLLYGDPAANADLLTEYGVDFIYISNEERNRLDVDEAYISEHYPLWYSSDDINIYAVSARARNTVETNDDLS